MTGQAAARAAPTSKAVVYVVDDDDSFRKGVIRLLRAAGYEARPFGSAEEFLLAAPGDEAGCVLLDIQMPGPSGLDLQEALARLAEPPPVIFVSGQGSIPESVRAMKAGAMDFLTKPVKREVLLPAIESALERAAIARAGRQKLGAARLLYETLTPREREVFAGVVAGKLNKEIAGELGTVERTVKAQRAKVMAKMNAQSVAELVGIAYHLRDSGIGPRPSA